MKHEYLMLYRPFGIACQPDGAADYVELVPGSRGYGIVTYDRPLTADEIRDFELEAIA